MRKKDKQYKQYKKINKIRILSQISLNMRFITRQFINAVINKQKIDLNIINVTE